MRWSLWGALAGLVVAYCSAPLYAGETQLNVTAYALAPDSSHSPCDSPGIRPAIDSITKTQQLPRWINPAAGPSRDWRTNVGPIPDPPPIRYDDIPGYPNAHGGKLSISDIPDSVMKAMQARQTARMERHQALVDSLQQAALKDTTPNEDSWGCVHFNLVKREPFPEWRVRAKDGTVWALRQTGNAQSRKRAGEKAASPYDKYFEVLRNDSVVRKITTYKWGEAGVSAAFVWGDSSIIEYVGHGGTHVLINGEDLNANVHCTEVFGFHILAGKPFYFFKRGNRFGWSYAGKEPAELYNTMSREGHCDELYEDMVPSFGRSDWRILAQRDGMWYLLVGGVTE